MDFHWINFQKHGWGKVYLHDSHGGWNQKWQFDGREFVCKGFENKRVHDLRLDVEGHNTHDGAKVGVFKANGGMNQQWNIQSKSDVNLRQSGYLDFRNSCISFQIMIKTMEEHGFLHQIMGHFLQIMEPFHLPTLVILQNGKG